MSDELQTEEDAKGMRAALERAHEQAQPPEPQPAVPPPPATQPPPAVAPQAPAPSAEAPAPAGGVPELDAMLEKMRQSYPDHTETPAVAEEATSKETGDAQESSGSPAVPPPTEPWARIKHDLRQNETTAPAPSALAEKMKSVGWNPSDAPKPAPGGPTDWAKLQSDLRAAEAGADAQKNINAMIHAAAPGFEPPSGAGEGRVEAAKAAIAGHEKLLSESRQQDQDKIAAERAKSEEALRNQQVEASKAEMEHKSKADLLATTKDQAMNDPASPESERARAALKPVFAMTGQVPEGFDGWSAAAVEKYAKTLTPIATGAEGRKKTEADLATKAKTEAGNDATLEERRPILARDPRAAKLGFTPEQISHMNKDGLDKLQQEIESLDKAKPHGTGAPAKEVHSIADIPDPGDKAAVRAILDGQDAAEKYGRKEGPRLLKLARQIDPNFDSTKAGVYRHVAEQLSTDKSIGAARTAADHLARAKANIPENYDANMLNRIANNVTKGAGGTGLTGFEADVAVAAAELATAYGENAEAGKEELRKLLDPNQSKAQLHHSIDELEHLMEARIQSKRDQFMSAAPKGTALPAMLQPRPEAAAPIGAGADPIVSLTAKDGRVKRVKKSAADAWLKAHPNEATISE